MGLDARSRRSPCARACCANKREPGAPGHPVRRRTKKTRPGGHTNAQSAQGGVAPGPALNKGPKAIVQARHRPSPRAFASQTEFCPGHARTDANSPRTRSRGAGTAVTGSKRGISARPSRGRCPRVTRSSCARSSGVAVAPRGWALGSLAQCGGRRGGEAWAGSGRCGARASGSHGEGREEAGERGGMAPMPPAEWGWAPSLRALTGQNSHAGDLRPRIERGRLHHRHARGRGHRMAHPPAALRDVAQRAGRRSQVRGRGEAGQRPRPVAGRGEREKRLRWQRGQRADALSLLSRPAFPISVSQLRTLEEKDPIRHAVIDVRQGGALRRPAAAARRRPGARLQRDERRARRPEAASTSRSASELRATHVPLAALGDALVDAKRWPAGPVPHPDHGTFLGDSLRASSLATVDALGPRPGRDQAQAASPTVAFECLRTRSLCFRQ